VQNFQSFFLSSFKHQDRLKFAYVVQQHVPDDRGRRWVASTGSLMCISWRRTIFRQLLMLLVAILNDFVSSVRFYH